MASKISKLRDEYKKEIAERKRIMKDVVIERRKPIITTSSSSDTQKKLTLDSQKLQETIAKAIETSESLKKKPIVVLDKIPSSHNNPVVPVPVPVTICKARNLNGTPCKCKAIKLGKFCAKHTP